jgi:DnaJ-class molecular chaperone
MKDYYDILHIPPTAAEKDIKKAYRQLALKYHPDRNPGDKAAEDRFKSIAEAYSVLIDPEKRQRYDIGARNGYAPQDGDFGYGGEDVFSSVFNDPRQQAFFDELRREFEQQGFRFDEKFMNDLFARGGGFVFGGIFSSGPHGVRYKTFGKSSGPLRDAMAGIPETWRGAPKPPTLGQIAENIGQKIGQFLSGWLPNQTSGELDGNAITSKDIHYRITLSHQEARQGKEVVIAYQRGNLQEKLSVKVPAGIKNGTKLKLKRMGIPTPGDEIPGNLYVQVNIQ